ncbi:MAG: hypothetical protein HIU82_03225 [Proteobacteria bacterium]|nr:hypothetical protein [Pseudomonadota bacterium]
MRRRRLEEGQGRSNCQTLFAITRIPTDATIRRMLDGAPPEGFEGLFRQALEVAGPLAAFRRLDDRVLIALDGNCQRRRENASAWRSKNASETAPEGPRGDLPVFRREGAPGKGR